MSDAILYLDTSDVREGALEELTSAVERLVEFVKTNEPRLIAYNVYFTDDGTGMTVVSVHPDAASLEYHLEVADRSSGSSWSSSRCPRSRSTASRARWRCDRLTRSHACWVARRFGWSPCTRGSPAAISFANPPGEERDGADDFDLDISQLRCEPLLKPLWSSSTLEKIPFRLYRRMRRRPRKLCATPRPRIVLPKRTPPEAR